MLSAFFRCTCLSLYYFIYSESKDLYIIHWIVGLPLQRCILPKINLLKLELHLLYSISNLLPFSIEPPLDHPLTSTFISLIMPFSFSFLYLLLPTVHHLGSLSYNQGFVIGHCHFYKYLQIISLGLLKAD
jgi:hypothetical protein